MKRILAVIPARAGSKGIPNKNIRMIGLRPLVYYAIHNALASRYITDVIVTTDSPEVGAIATRMGAQCRWRDKALCGDAVTLDAVIADAIPEDVRWDYIVTLQPTSPTLKTETLDRAIGYTLESGVDTLISAVNAPRLSWGIKDGAVTPNYAARLNRQYLPPCYVETGAFVVSRASVVTPQTRIGARVEVFELPEDEALDVDTFADLRNASAILEKQRVGIYAHGGVALDIADEFYEKPDILCDVDMAGTDLFCATCHHVVPVEDMAALYQRCREKQYTLFINACGDTSLAYMKGLRAALPSAKIVNYQDEGPGGSEADLLLSGQEYYIVPKPFLFCLPVEIRPCVRRVLVAFDGRDAQRHTRSLQAVAARPEFAQYDFVIFQGVQDIPGCDFAITSRGPMAWNMAALGMPAIIMDQGKAIEERLKAILTLSQEDRQRMQDEQLRQELREGRRRVVARINSLE